MIGTVREQGVASILLAVTGGLFLFRSPLLAILAGILQAIVVFSILDERDA